MKRLVRQLLRFNLRRFLLLVALVGIYIGGYLANRDPVVAFETETLVCTANFISLRVSPVYASEYALRAEPLPEQRAKACSWRDPGYRFLSPLSRVIFKPAACVERSYWKGLYDLKHGQNEADWRADQPPELIEKCSNRGIGFAKLE